MKAFPISVMTFEPDHPDSPRYTTTWHAGMDLRDYFAAKAMQGILFEGLDPADTAKSAYEMADAMLKARGSDGQA